MSEIEFTEHTHQHTHLLKQLCLELAQQLMPGEGMTSQDALCSLTVVVARIFADPHTTPVQMALIAHGLASFIENKP